MAATIPSLMAAAASANSDAKPRVCSSSRRSIEATCPSSIARQSLMTSLTASSKVVRLTAATDRGVKVACENTHKWTTLLHVSGEVFALRLSESLDSRKRKLTAAQRRSNDELSDLALYPETEKYPSGSLSLTIRGEKDEAVQKRWAERDGTRLEDRLNEVIAWLFRAADRLGARRSDRDEWRRQFDVERRDHEEAERRRVEEERRLEKLERDAAAWRRACRIRSYVNAVERAAVQRGDGIGEDCEIVAWMTWARQQAEEIDPITRQDEGDDE